MASGVSAGLVARSPEGHAAKGGMPIKDNQDLWVEIQAHTFTNWINEHLRKCGAEVHDLAEDLSDGTRLCMLLEVLQGRQLRGWLRNPANRHQRLENASRALAAIEEDGVKLVNIGNVDIVNGNLKLLLGLIWSLIVRYQIGRSKFPPKKLMLAWLKAVLPECKVTNLTNDWNSGIFLSALLDYCRPGLFPDWRDLDSRDSTINCRRAMTLARDQLGVPMVLDPEYLASPYLDELSGMTYLSYFMKEGGPGYLATLRYAQNQLSQLRISNFTTSWNDGRAACELVRSLGGSAPAAHELNPLHAEANLEKGLRAGQRLGVEPILRARDMADSNVEHLGVMAWAARFQWLKPRARPGQRLAVRGPGSGQRVQKPMTFHIDVVEEAVDPREVRVEVIGPSGELLDCRLNLSSRGTGSGTFTPIEVGMHRIIVYNEDEAVINCPVDVRVMPEITKIQYPGLEPCAIGSIVEVLINAKGADPREVRVEARAPSGRVLSCPVAETPEGAHAAAFKPDEAGEWTIAVTHHGRHIQGGPFACFVYDPHAVKVSGLEGAMAGQPFSFTLDTSGTGGLGDVHIDVVHQGRSLTIERRRVGPGVYSIRLTPSQPGKHRIYLYFNGHDVKGSPFPLRVGGVKTRHSDSHKQTIQQYNNTNSYDRHQERTSWSPLGKASPSSPSGRMDSATRIDSTGRVDSSGRMDSSYHEEIAHRVSRTRLSDSPSSPTQQSSTVPPTMNGHASPFRPIYRASPTPPVYRASPPPPVTSYRASPPVSQSPYRASPKTTFLNGNHSSTQATNHSTQATVDTTSNVRVSSLTSTPTRADSWDAIAKTRGLLSHGSLESLANLTNTISTNEQSKFNSNEQSKFHHSTSELTSSRVQHHSTSSSGMKTSQNVTYSPPSPTLNRVQHHSTSSSGMKTSQNVTYSPPSPTLNRVQHHSTSTSGMKTSQNVTYSPPSPTLNRVQHHSTSSSGMKTSQNVMYSSPSPILNRVQHHSTSSSGMKSSQNVTYNPPSPTLNRVQHHSTSSSGMKTSHNVSYNPSSPTFEALRWDQETPLASVHEEVLAIVTLPRPSDLALLTATAQSPSGGIVSGVQVRRGPHDTAHVSFIPTEVGEYFLDVRVRDSPINGSPFSMHAFDARAIKVGNIPDGQVGQPVKFQIDGRGAGSGNLEILVNGGHVTSHVEEAGAQRFIASFVPHEPMSHRVEMSFNGYPVPGSPWQVSVMASGGGSSGNSKISVIGEGIRLVASGQSASFLLSAPGFMPQDVDVSVSSPTKRPIHARVTEAGSEAGDLRVEFTPTEVGSHIVELSVSGQKLPAAGPLIAKVYNAALIRVTDVASGVVGQPCQFRVDASQAGEGQLEISINEGEVPNHVQVVGGGRCLVTFTPELAKIHLIDIKFNGEPVPGCPFVCAVSDTSRVSLTMLRNLELVPVGQIARFHMSVDGSGSAELAVSVRGPRGSELPVKVTGSVHSGFTAEFTPREVGGHTITVEYNGHPVAGTPFVAKAYDASRVFVGPVPQGSVGQSLHFTVDASQAGEGNLEITISSRGHNIPTQVHPQGNARFAVSFVPIEPADHIISVSFNKESVPGSPLVARVLGSESPQHVMVSGAALATAPVGQTSSFTVTGVHGSLEDIEVNVEGPNGQPVPAQVRDAGQNTFHVDFLPRLAGEHRIAVVYRQTPVTGSPFLTKVYDVRAIKVKHVARGVIGKPVTFIVETAQAGPGNLEVTVNGGQVPTSAQAQGPHQYAISFTPRESTQHTVHLRFNGEEVPGSPFICSVAEAARVLAGAEGLEKVAVGRRASFTIEAESSLGRPEVQVLGPARRHVTVELVPNSNGTPNESGATAYTTYWTPTQVGDHSIEVTLGGSHVEGSPFLVKAYDASKVLVTDIQPGSVGKPVFFSINASQAGAGNLEIIVSVAGRNVPNYVQSEGNARFRVNFKPQEAAPHSLSVRFNSEPVPGSPFTCKVLEASEAVVSGSGIKMAPVNQAAEVRVEPRGLNGSEPGRCHVSVTSPSGRLISVANSNEDQALWRFTPLEVGRHSIAVTVNGEPAKGSPFACNVYDVSKVRVSSLGPARVGKPATFTVDASEAGEGTLELVVSTDQATVKAEVVACSRGLYDVTYVPHHAIPHFVNISFNECDVPGSPFRCEVLDLPSSARDRRPILRGDGLAEVPLGAQGVFTLDPRGLEAAAEAIVHDPEGETVPCRVTRLASGHVRFEYEPSLVGPHTVTVRYAGAPVGKPHRVCVFNPRAGRIVDRDDAFLHRPCSFTLDVSSCGASLPGIEGGASGPRVTARIIAAGQEVPHTLDPTGIPGRYRLVFHPKLAVPHRVDVRLNGHHIQDSPLEVTVRNPAVGQDVIASGLGLYQARAGKATSFIIETLGHSANQFDVLVTGPRGAAVPVRCYQHKDGNLLAEFTPPTPGTYKVDVTQETRPVRGSPYYCQVFDASKVRVEASQIGKSLNVNDNIAFTLLRKEAGFAELEVTVTSPLGQDLPLELRGTGPDKDSDLIEFTPTLPGQYRFKIAYGGEQVPGSPITFTVEEAGVARASGDGLINAIVGRPAQFRIHGANLSGRPSVQVDGPETVAAATVSPDGGGQDGANYLATYTPLEPGVFDIAITWGGASLPGSPFHPRVVDPARVRAIGGWDSILDSEGRISGLSVGQSFKISLDTSAAGPGQLTAECRSPNGETIPVNLEPGASPGRFRLILTPRHQGDHSLHLKYNGFALPRSPLTGSARSVSRDSTDAIISSAPVRVSLSGRGLAAAKAGEEAEFSIDGTQGGPGTPEVAMTGPKGDVKVTLQPLGPSVYRASYTASHPGTYLLNVLWSERQVKGCPLKVAIAAASDAAAVVCSGEGLRIGTVGKEIRSFIDTRRAGPGELTAHCVGPHKVAYCELYEHGDGTFTLNIKPQEPGKHQLTIKYDQDHVPGSPFRLRVHGAPDASKVRVYGPGIEHGVLATFQSRFICDTRGAGAGQLTVRVRGPKGAFRVEMQRESQKDRTILCKFDPTEPGDYRVEVKWAGELVPGSPFVVMIFDTQEELTRFLHGGHSPGSNSDQPLYAGSVGYSTGYAHLTLGGGGGGGAASWRGSQPQL